MSRTLSGDPKIQQAREKAKASREMQEARIARLKADRLESLLMPVDDHRGQMLALATRVKRALDSLPSYLPAHLTPEERETCEQAISQAVQAAMHAIPDTID